MAAEPEYIESDEEIPEVVERLRRRAGSEVSIVVPHHSRLGQSRFNFQLLKASAERLGKRVVIVSSDPAVQAMAAEVGLGGTSLTAPPASEPSLTAPALEAPGLPADTAAAAPPPVAPLPVPPLPLSPRPVASAAAAPAAGAPPRIRFTPSAEAARPSVRGYGGRGGLYLGALLVLLAGLLGTVFYVPSADVTLVAHAKPFSSDITLTAAPGTGNIRVTTQTDSQTATGSFKATGTFTIPATFATVTEIVYNQCATGSITLTPSIQKGQDFTDTQDNVVFTYTGNQVTLSQPQNSLALTAVNAGTSGNVAANRITTINGWPPPGTSKFLAQCLSANNPSAATGGADASSKPQISEGDVQGAQSTMQQNLRTQIQSDLEGKVQSGYKLSDTIVFNPPTFSTDHAPGDQVQGFNATMTLKGEGAYYNTSDVKKAFIAAARQKVPGGQQMTDTTPTVTYTVTGTSGGHLTFTGTVNGFVATRLNLNQVKSSVVAKSVHSAQANLKKLPIASAQIRQSPLRLPWMPLLSSRIRVDYVVEQGTPTSTS